MILIPFSQKQLLVLAVIVNNRIVKPADIGKKISFDLVSQTHQYDIVKDLKAHKIVFFENNVLNVNHSLLKNHKQLFLDKKDYHESKIAYHEDCRIALKKIIWFINFPGMNDKYVIREVLGQR